MKNWKTSACGLVGGLGVVFPMIGLPVELGNAVSVVGLFLLGIFSKDCNVTGGDVKQ